MSRESIDDPGAAPAPAGEPRAAPEGPLRILLVEDNEADVYLIRRSLAAGPSAVEITDCRSVDEALAHLEERPDGFDLLMTDHGLPGRSGLDLCREVKASTLDLPVIMLTGAGTEELLVQALREGVDEYLIKDHHQGFLQLLPLVLPAVMRRHRDRVERQWAERELRRTNRELAAQAEVLKQARERADQANRAKSAFLANLSHEIRTPMTAILGLTDMVLEDDAIRHGSPERVRDLETIRDNGQYLLRLLNDILDLSKIEAEKLEIERQRFPLPEFLADLMSLMRVRSREKGLSLELRGDGAVPRTLESDPTRLRQILINLLGNAIKFTATGGVGLEIRLHRGASPGPKLELAVVDTGIGMREEEVSHVFRPFFQAAAGAAVRYAGTGLGLSISRRLAAMLGGDIAVESRYGEGSTFRLTVATGSLDGVPLIDDLPRAVAAAEHPSPPPAARRRLDCRVLLAEDDPVNQTVLRHMLTKAGVDLTLAGDGEEAVELALAAEASEPFELVLMDIKMPRLDGLEATRRLRGQGYRQPILALTAQSLSDQRDECLAAGCDGHLVKPIQREALIEAIAGALEGGPGEPPAG